MPGNAWIRWALGCVLVGGAACSVEGVPPRLSAGLPEPAAPWFRIENGQIAADFSPDPHHSPENVALKGFSRPIFSETAAPRRFWTDEINGAPLETRSVTGEAVLNQAVGAFDAHFDLSSDPELPIRFSRSVRLTEDGASFEVNYSFQNLDARPRKVEYVLLLPWITSPDTPAFRVHAPLCTGILREAVQPPAMARPIACEEFAAPWLAFEFDQCQTHFLVAADRRFGDVQVPPVGSDQPVRVPMMSVVLRPGEIAQASFWMAFTQGLGTPVAVGPNYAAGACFVPAGLGGAYRLETRFFSMPRAQKRFRLFTAVAESGRVGGYAPEYTQRSLLPSISPLTVMHNPVLREGFYELEQSVYSGSERRGYWKVLLCTPGIAGPQAGASPFTAGAPAPPVGVDSRPLPPEWADAPGWTPVPETPEPADAATAPAAEPARAPAVPDWGAPEVVDLGATVETLLTASVEPPPTDPPVGTTDSGPPPEEPPVAPNPGTADDLWGEAETSDKTAPEEPPQPLILGPPLPVR